METTRASYSGLKPVRTWSIWSSSETIWPVEARASIIPFILRRYSTMFAPPFFMVWSCILCCMICALNWEAKSFSNFCQISNKILDPSMCERIFLLMGDKSQQMRSWSYFCYVMKAWLIWPHSWSNFVRNSWGKSMQDETLKSMDFKGCHHLLAP